MERKEWKEVCELFMQAAGDLLRDIDNEVPQPDSMVTFSGMILDLAGEFIRQGALSMVDLGKGKKNFSFTIECNHDSDGAPLWRLYASNTTGSGQDWESLNENVHSTEGMAALVGAALGVGAQREVKTQAEKTQAIIENLLKRIQKYMEKVENDEDDDFAGVTVAGADDEGEETGVFTVFSGLVDEPDETAPVTD